MALETSGIGRYDETTLLDNRTAAQIQVVATGDPSNGRTPGETSDLLDFPLDFLYKGKGNSSITNWQQGAADRPAVNRLSRGDYLDLSGRPVIQ